MYPQNFNQPVVIIKPSGHRSAFKVVLAVVAVLIALLLGLIVLLLIGIEAGPVGLLIGLVVATLPVPVYLGLALWIDRYESEPLWMLGTAFFWGALVAVFIAFVFNTASSVMVAVVTESEAAGEAFGAVISAPIVEETAKAIILFIFFFAKRDEFDGVVDGIVYAAMAGLGFAMTENIQYYARAFMDEHQRLSTVFILRGTLAPFSHPLFTSFTGIGLGFARQSTSTFVKVLAPIAGFAVAIGLHATWNGSIVVFGGAGFLVTYLLVMVPTFAIILVIIALALRREGQIVREFLINDFQGGVFTPEEYNRLGTIRGRMGANFNAFSRGGLGHWRVSRQFHQTASELAFHRSRLARGIKTSDAQEREAALQMVLRDLMQKLR
ncbi:MAG TPA: PrsW family intramembrane metalloprotease [Pyrinomonadaceae bacterium]|nr:PrsW family intramembrane metalloprotease [Pyrinomonadaceae bacterium]